MTVSWNEATDGDLSNVIASPTNLGAVSHGNNEISAGLPESDNLDEFSFVVGDGLVVEDIIVTALDVTGFANGFNLYLAFVGGVVVGSLNTQNSGLSVGQSLFDKPQFGSSLPLGAGTYLFDLRAFDTSYGANAYGLNLVVKTVNVAPVALGDAADVGEDAAGVVSVLGNDSDENGEALSVIRVDGQAATAGTPVTLASGALVTLNAGGTFSYDPNDRFESLGQGATATDSFTYTVTDGRRGTTPATATATITILGANDAPTDVTLTGGGVAENAAGAVVGDLAASDVDAGDSHSFAVSDGRFEVAGAQLRLKAGVSLDFEAEPSVVLQVTATDAAGLGVTRAVTVTVEDVAENRAPEAGDDARDVQEDARLFIPVAALLADDVDPDGDALTIIGVGGASTGTVSLADGVVTFRAARGFDGAASFTYDVADSSGEIDTGTVLVTVTPTIRGTGRSQTIDGSEFADRILAGGGRDVVNGFDGDDRLFGGRGDDLLSGGEGVDQLFGGRGRDRLVGGADQDLLRGGAGADRFVLDAVEDSAPGAESRDIVFDFSRRERDVIDLRGIDAVAGGDDQAFSFIGVAAFGADASGQLRVEDLGTTLVLQGSTDADAAAEFEIELRSFGGVLVRGDFLL